jgi:hypothetical protein
MGHLFKRLQNLGDMLRAGLKSFKKIRERFVIGFKPLNFWLLKHPLRKQKIAFGTAQYPKMAPYAPNINGPRTASDAIALAKSKGIEIPDDIYIGFMKNWMRTDADAEYFYRKDEFEPNDWIKWTDFYHDKTGKIPVRFNVNILESDEAIIAHIAHEMHELNALRQIFDKEEGEIQAQKLMRHIAPGIPKNLHDQAWEVADKMVRVLRGNDENR